MSDQLRACKRFDRTVAAGGFAPAKPQKARKSRGKRNLGRWRAASQQGFRAESNSGLDFGLNQE
jgi:hypothetical protein